MTEEPRLLGGRYELGGVLGRGGMAEVRRARDLRLSRDVAVKQLRVDLATDPTFQARFRREAQSSAGLNHPNIVSVYDTGEEPDPATKVSVPYIVMELVEGHTLREILRTGRQIQPSKALEFAQGVLEALEYSHKAGIVHRDIKPANVMLTPNGTVKVMDFGIARAVADTSATMTQTAAVIGTAQYLSPEQARGETVDSRSDIYSAGCLLYELLVGRPPFQGDSPVSVAYQHVREAPVPPSHLDGMISPAMDAIVLKALSKDPADRYQTAAAMRADIGRLLAGQEVRATLPSPVPSGAAEPTMVHSSPTLPPPAFDTGTQPGARALVPEPKRRKSLWAFLIALGVLAASVGMYFLFNPLNRVETVAVPLVAGQRVADARQILTAAGLLPLHQVPDTGLHRALLTRATYGCPRILQVVHRHAIRPEDQFKMEPGFANLASAKEGQLLARDASGEIRAEANGLVMLPLYQGQGADGFFWGRPVSNTRLLASTVARRLHLDWLLPLSLIHI